MGGKKVFFFFFFFLGAGVEFAAVIDDAVAPASNNCQLHLDVVDRPAPSIALTSRIDSLSSLEILQVEGVFRGDLDDRRLRLENRVEQTDQGDAIAAVPKIFFEGKIIDGRIPAAWRSAAVSEFRTPGVAPS